MRQILFVTALLALATACPKVERKVYVFDMKARTGVLKFENIVTDSPETQNNDFMEIVNQVIRGTKLEEEHPGWRIGKKELVEAEGRLDGVMEFTFDDARGAGLYQHDKKSGYVWCTSRNEEETIVSTNGTRLDDVLPGCVAWDRKTAVLEVTVRSATMAGGEKPLLDPFRKWSAGEELELTDAPFGMSESGLEGFGEAFAGGLADGIADAMAPNATLTVGEPTVKGGEAADGAVIGAVQRSTMKICLATEAAVNSFFEETLAIEVRPDGTWAAKLTKGVAANPPELFECVSKALTDVKFPLRAKAWTIEVPLSVAHKP